MSALPVTPWQTDGAAPEAVTTRAHGLVRSRGYRRAYRVRASAGACQLQRVHVRIRYRVGGHDLATFDQLYHEFFRFEAPDAGPLMDVHDFDVVRDGWHPGSFLGLVDRHRVARRPDGSPELIVGKRFVIGRGAVTGDAAVELEDGASFGFLASAQGRRSATRLRVARGDGTFATFSDLPPCPDGFPVAGSGTRRPGPTFTACERFRYRFAHLLGDFVDRGGYRP
ncbi:MAG: hypothetical protein KAI24_07445, partial [Planctomycetes bacterium]|nr:hypothetical protein [Planctomycetota bacterium]